MKRYQMHQRKGDGQLCTCNYAVTVNESTKILLERFRFMIGAGTAGKLLS